MADIFRLLTRSTTFAKGAGSAAATANTKAKANKPTTTTTITTAITPSSSGALPGELDFFGTGIKRSRDEIDDEGNSHSDRGGDGEEEELGLREPPVLEQEEIRALLRKHKLKFTLLESPNADEDKQKKEKKKKEELIIQPLTSFTHLHKLSPRLHRNMRARGYQVPTEVQMGAIPVISRGENLICCAPTGSGKTMAFMVPVLDWILAQRRDQKGKRKVRAVVVAPTKELAGQIVNEGKKLALGTGVRVALLKKGGEGVRSEIVVSTPAVLLHSLEASSASPSSGKEEEEKKKTDWSSVSRLILDEADILLDPLFRAQTLGIWTKLQTPHLRTFLFSATISSSTETLCRQHISPSHTSPSSTIRLIVGLKDTTTHNISQKLTYTATEAGKLLALRQLFTTSFHPPALIFVQTIPRARALVAEILYDLPTPGRIAVLHAELSDVARAEVMSRFLAGEIWVLVTTDLLARGVDFRGVRCVVNYDIPTSVAGYIHRVGRMGRSGGVEGGSAVTYYTEGDVQFVKGIAGVIAKAQGEEKGGEGRWLLDALPKVGKIAKERLKKRGVEARSKAADGKEGRISTKSGYERRREDRRRGAVEGSKRRKVEAAAGGGGGDSDGEEDDEEEFVGIQDLD